MTFAGIAPPGMGMAAPAWPLGGQARLDDDTLLLFARQLEMVETKIYQKHYPELRCKQHFAVDNQGGATNMGRTYRLMDRRGYAQWGLNFPRVAITASERTIMPKEFSVGYGYSFLDMQRAAAAGTNLDAAEALVAARAVAEFENRVAYFGDADREIPGAFNHPNFPIVLLDTPIGPNAASSAAIVRMFNYFIQTASRLSNNVENFTTVLMPNEKLQYLRGTPYSDAAPQITLMQRIQESNLGIEFDWCNECKGTGTNGADIMFAYNRAEENMVLWIPHPAEVLQTMISPTYDYTTGVWELIGGQLVRYAVGAIGEIPA